MKKIVIVGSSGHAKVVIDIVEHEGKYKIAGLLDRFKNIGEKTFDYEILGQENDIPLLIKKLGLSGVLVAIGDNFTRAKTVSQIIELCPDFPFVNAVHPNSSIGRDVVIGCGTVIMAGVSVNPSCSIGSHCLLNTNSSLDHDSSMESFSSLAPQACIGGSCRIGAYS